MGKQDREEWDRIRSQARRQAQDKRNNAIQARLEREAQEERDRKLDKSFEDEARALFGMDIADIEEGIEDFKGPSDADIEAATAAIRAARKAAEPGIIFGANPEKAKKILNKNQAAIKKAAAKTRSGCAVVGLLTLTAVLGAAGGSIWGVAEIISAMR
jgi:hypothetical protein